MVTKKRRNPASVLATADYARTSNLMKYFGGEVEELTDVKVKGDVAFIPVHSYDLSDGTLAELTMFPKLLEGKMSVRLFVPKQVIVLILEVEAWAKAERMGFKVPNPAAQ
jgi:hypothetical protein